jgi:hypothetical protein
VAVGTNVRALRWLLWSVALLAIVTALISIGLVLHIPVVPPVVAADADLPTALIADRAYDNQVYPIVVIGAIAAAALFGLLALLGPRLRPYIANGGWSDEIVLAFAVAGALGIASQLVNLAVAHEAAQGYCDCVFKNEDLISQARALGVGWSVQTWLVVAAQVIAALAIAGVGASVRIGAGWTLLSDVLLLAALLVAVLALIGADELSQIVSGLFVLVALPAWALVLARRLPQATASTA